MTFLITCPNCGPREALEFSYGGETTERAGPTATDRELAAALYFRRNVDGWQIEWWVHQSGCRAWFLAERHTTTNEIRRTYRPEDRSAAPGPAGDEPGQQAQGERGTGREATLA